MTERDGKQSLTRHRFLSSSALVAGATFGLAGAGLWLSRAQTALAASTTLVEVNQVGYLLDQAKSFLIQAASSLGNSIGFSVISTANGTSVLKSNATLANGPTGWPGVYYQGNFSALKTSGTYKVQQTDDATVITCLVEYTRIQPNDTTRLAWIKTAVKAYMDFKVATTARSTDTGNNSYATPLIYYRNSSGTWKTRFFEPLDDLTAPDELPSNWDSGYTGRLISFNPLQTVATAILVWERFRWIDLGGGEIALQADTNGSYVRGPQYSVGVPSCLYPGLGNLPVGYRITFLSCEDAQSSP